MKIQPFLFFINESFYGEKIFFFKSPYFIVFKRYNNISKCINDSPFSVNNTGKTTSELWVTPKIFAKRNHLLVVNINVSILVLMISDQR